MRESSASPWPALPRGKKLYVATGDPIQSGGDPGSGPDRCAICRHRRRGKRHEEGDHHRGTVKRCSRS